MSSAALSEACGALTALEGGRVSLFYDEPGFALSVTVQAHSGWFWCIYDRKAGKVVGCGCALTAQAAAEAALQSRRAPPIPASRSAGQPIAAE
jgi:hypothetical protein